MIIGFDGSRAFVSGRTGTENYSYQLLRSLSKADKINKYIVYLRPGISVREKFPKSFKFVEINWPRFWTQGGLGIRTFKDPLDVLFIPAHTLPLIRKPGIRTVVTVHDLGSQFLPQAHQLKQRLYLGLMQKYQLRGVNKIIAVSKATKVDLTRSGIDPKKIEVVYEGYDDNLFRPVKNDILVNSLKHLGLEAGKYFLFVGTVQPRKNLERVIRAFAVIAHLEGGGLRLVIAGQRGWMSEEIYQLPRKLGIEDKVKFLGYVPDDDLPALYSGAVALLFPSLFEGFGLPILEAQACGCPVLTSNVSSMPEVAGPPAGGAAVLVNSESVDDIVKGMERVKREGERVKLIQKGLENVRRFSWEKCATKTLKVLESVSGI